MSDKRPPSGGQGQGRGNTQSGNRPGGIGRGYQPAHAPNNPGAGHQPAGTGTPQPPTTGSGVKPTPAKK
jgi:hypothetical protein